MTRIDYFIPVAIVTSGTIGVEALELFTKNIARCIPDLCPPISNCVYTGLGVLKHRPDHTPWCCMHTNSPHYGYSLTTYVKDLGKQTNPFRSLAYILITNNLGTCP